MKSTNKYILVEDSLDNAIKQAEQNLKQVGSDIEEVSTQGDIEEALDLAYENNVEVNEDGMGQFISVLLIGHAGVGKTQRVKAWCNNHKPPLHLVCKDAKVEDIGNLAGIFAPNEDKTKAMNLPTGAYDELDNPDTVLFLDEFNRASSAVRFTLAQLINEHKIPNSQERGGYHYFSGLQLVVAAINPAKYGEYNTEPMDVAELDRFYKAYVQPDKANTLEYLTNKYNKKLEQDLAKGDERAYQRDLGKKNLAIELLSSRYFEFDDDEEIAQSGEDEEHILSPRGLENAIQLSKGTKDGLLKVWNNVCNPRKKGMIERILANYQDVDDKANSVFKKDLPFKKSGSDDWKKIQNKLDQV